MTSLVPNARSHQIEESATLAIAARAMQLRAEGKNVIALGAGEPDFPTPDGIARAGIRAIEQGKYRYTATSGLPQLRAAGAKWLAAAFDLHYAAEEVLVTAGAKPALHMALDTIVEKGDRVLVLAPYWVSYPALVRMADGVPVIVPPVPEQDFVHTESQIAALAQQSGAKGMILNFPNNPSGAVPTRSQLEGIVGAAEKHGMWIVSDEIYAQIRYDQAPHVSPASLPGGRERTMVVTGFTKSHTLTGWRVGFLAGPKRVIDAAARIQSQVLGNACTISQEASLAACAEPPHEEIARRLPILDERRCFLVRQINTIRDLKLAMPNGTFYALIDARALCARLGIDDVRLCTQLLEQQLLATIPGSAFGAPGFVRLSYAAPMTDLEAAVMRLRAFVDEGAS
jgi:aspartate aminotransferase